MQIKKAIQAFADKKRAAFLQKYFKTGKGEYAEGDKFLGLTVPQCRNLAKKYTSLSYQDLKSLLESKIHEYRQIALMVLVLKFTKGDEEEKRLAHNFYLENTKYINNWDLVDGSAPVVIGEYVINRDRSILYQLAKSLNLWERRIAVLSTFAFIKRSDFTDALKLTRMLLGDKEDLMHKATGWMLREIGKRNRKRLEDFLKKNYQLIPRTTLRYAIERFPPALRTRYLSGNI